MNTTCCLDIGLNLKETSLKEFSIFSSGGHFVRRCGTVGASLVEGIMNDEHLGEIILNLDQHMSIFFIFNSGGHFDWRSGTVWAILVPENYNHNHRIIPK